MRNRPGIAYVVEINGPAITLNLQEGHRGHVASHSEGISGIGQPGDLIGIQNGSELIVLRILSIQFVEPKEVHLNDIQKGNLKAEPLRQVTARSIGYLFRNKGQLMFAGEEWHLPALGSEAFPLSSEETQAVYQPSIDGLADTPIQDDSRFLKIGWDARDRGTPIFLDTNRFLARHSAILGSTGYGKTTFVTAVLHDLLKLPRTRIVVFDINNEYSKAFQGLPNGMVKKTIIGKPTANPEPNADYYQIPYYALGRAGLIRLLTPSDKTQLGPLKFAIDNLKFLAAESAIEGARLSVGQNNIFFDDCRPTNTSMAFNDLQRLRTDNSIPQATTWPHMKALACLAAEAHCLKSDKRDAFLYGHIQTMINRIRHHIDDELFRAVVNIHGGLPLGSILSWKTEGQALINRIFGPAEFDEESWKIHIVDLSHMTQDLSPFILGALLELYATELFHRGPGNTHPTLLVLEEAHHYIRTLPSESEGNRSLAYERLAKEGRKFGLSLMVSTQRPSDLSSTVLSQCGTWTVFRLTNEKDQQAVKAASEWGDGYINKQIPGLPRGQAVVFGAALSTPCRINVIRPDEGKRPDSNDSDFVVAWREKEPAIST